MINIVSDEEERSKFDIWKFYACFEKSNKDLTEELDSVIKCEKCQTFYKNLSFTRS